MNGEIRTLCVWDWHYFAKLSMARRCFRQLIWNIVPPPLPPPPPMMIFLKQFPINSWRHLSTSGEHTVLTQHKFNERSLIGLTHLKEYGKLCMINICRTFRPSSIYSALEQFGREYAIYWETREDTPALNFNRYNPWLLFVCVYKLNLVKMGPFTTLAIIFECTFEKLMINISRIIITTTIIIKCCGFLWSWNLYALN